MKGTQWVIKTPRLKCRCGCTLHFECRGRWAIKYDSPASEYTLSMSPVDTDALRLRVANLEEENQTLKFIIRDKEYDEQERPPRAEDDSEG